MHPSTVKLTTFMLSLQSLDEDCTLEEEEEGLIEEEEEIDQFNDDTFGAGAIGECSVECHHVTTEPQVVCSQFSKSKCRCDNLK